VASHEVGYELIRELGRGGMGIVYLARQRSLDRLVALKLLNTRRHETPVLLERFRREGQVLRDMVHPNVVRLLDYDLEADEPYLVCELIEGEQTLDSLLETAPPLLHDAVLIGTGVADGLAYIHDRGIVHRDLKPGNVLVDRAGHPHIIDLGLSRFLDAESSLTADGQILGTFSYMAPEQTIGRKVDARGDIYQLGLILYELAARRLVFSSRAADPVPPASRMAGDIPRLTDRNRSVPPALERLVTRCLAREPADRPARARDVADELARIREGLAPDRDASRDRTVPGAPAPAGPAGRPAGGTEATEPIAGPRTDPALAAPPRGDVLHVPCAERPLRSGVVPLGVLAGVGVLLLLASIRPGARGGGRPHESALAGPVAPPAGSPGSPAVARALLSGIVGAGAPDLERLLSSLDRALRERRHASGAEGALVAALGADRLARLRRTLSALDPLPVRASRDASLDRELLSQLAALSVVDEYLDSIGLSPIFRDPVARVLGPWADLRENPPPGPEPVLGLQGQAIRDRESGRWDWTLPDLPDRDALLVLVFNHMDPKKVLEVTVNRSVRLYYRNRRAAAGEGEYLIPKARMPHMPRLMPVRYTRASPFPEFVVLGRRLPRSALGTGANELRFRFITLPGPRVLPAGRSWAMSLDGGSLWHGFLPLLPAETGARSPAPGP
jgi:hypothetical protein